jgi:biopolymer transport protein TolQ
MWIATAGAILVETASAAPERLDPWKLVLGASLPVKAVLVVLVAFSLTCWVIIGLKAVHLRRAEADSARFLLAFDQAPSLAALAALVGVHGASPFARIFSRGFREFVRMTDGRPEALDDAKSVHVASVTRRAAAEEIQHLEAWMNLLGTIGSTSPFIGLFGTVYGIMDAFLGIGNQQSASLPVVAPKIAEALIATAVGLVAAIPSVMAHNYFSRRLGHLADQMDGVAEDVAARTKLGG